jgi:hypothetical protein
LRAREVHSDIFMLFLLYMQIVKLLDIWRAPEMDLFSLIRDSDSDWS